MQLIVSDLMSGGLREPGWTRREIIRSFVKSLAVNKRNLTNKKSA